MNATGTTPAALSVRVGWLCAAILFIEGYDIAVAGYVIPLLVDAWHVPPGAFIYALTAGNVGLLVGSLIGGLYGDRFGRKPVLIICMTTFGSLSLASAFARSPAQLAVLRALTGLGLGGGIPLALALASDFAAPVTKGRLVVLSSMGIPIGFALAGLLAVRLTGAFGWPSLFVAGGLAPLLLAILLAMRLPESPVLRAADRAQKGNISALFCGGRALCTLLLWAINLLNLLATYFLLLWTPAILHRAGASPSAAMAAALIFSLGVIASPALTATIVHRVGLERVLIVTLASGASCILAIGVLNPPFLSLVGLVFGAGIGSGSQAGVNALSALTYPPGIRATGAGWALGLGRIGGVAGPLLGGALLSNGLTGQQIYAVASVPAFGAAVLMAFLHARRNVR